MGGVPQPRPNTRARNPFWVSYWAVLSLPGLYYHIWGGFQIGVTPSDQIPEVGYALRAKYHVGVSAYGEIPERGYPSNQIPWGLSALFRSTTRVFYPVQIRCQNVTSPFRLNTRAALSLKAKYWEEGALARPNTRNRAPLQNEHQGGVILRSEISG